MESNGGTGGRLATCYNCGANDHFMMACPEPTRKVPAGLAAARASQAAQTTQYSPGLENTQESGGHRPFKRQKVGPVVTKFPTAPPPIITRYHQPTSESAPFTAGPAYYPNQAQSYQQQTSYAAPQPHAYGQPSYQQPYAEYGQQAYSPGAQTYGQPAYHTGQAYGQYQPYQNPQGYGYPPPVAQHHANNSQSVYGHLATPAVSQQHGYQQPQNVTSQSSNYQAPVASQPYGYDSSAPHGNNREQGYAHYKAYDQPTAPQSSQDFNPYQTPPNDSQSYQNPYNPNQSPRSQYPVNQWGQAATAASGYFPPTNAPQCGHPNYQQQPGAQPVHHQHGVNQYQPPQNPQFQQQQLQRTRSHTQHGPQSHPSAPMNSISPLQGSNQSITLSNSGMYINPNFSAMPSASRSSSISSNPQAGQTVLDNSIEIQRANEQSDFDWEMEKIFKSITHKGVSPIAHPLPLILDGKPIVPPAANNQGLITKYVRQGNQHIFVLPVEKSLHWATLRFDPVFKPIVLDSPLIPLEELENWLKGQLFRGNVPKFEPNIDPQHSRKRARSEDEQVDVEVQINTKEFYNQNLADSHSNATHTQQESNFPDTIRNTRSATPNLDGSSTPTMDRQGTPAMGIDDDAWAPQPGEGRVVTSPSDPMEALLASLGVTGAPKPISESPVDSHPPPASAKNANQEDKTQEARNRMPNRQDSGYVSARGSYSHASVSGSDVNGNRFDYRQSQWGGQQQPPPPPPRHFRKQYDGALESPPSDTSNRDVKQRRMSGSADTNSRVESTAAYYPGSSPLTPTSAELLGQEVIITQEHSNGRKPEPMRQVDDVTPKLKRRQPKVADAYSRRW